MISEFVRNKISRHYTHQRNIEFKNIVPDDMLIAQNIHSSESMGLYLHIPFCERICPYCPYNKELFSNNLCEKYVEAVVKEVDYYAEMCNNKAITSFYIGGGTPTTMLRNGIDRIINRIYKQFNMQCHIHMESHPNHLSNDNIRIIDSLNVKYLSIGIEALQDKYLKLIERQYNASEAIDTIKRAMNNGFECVNIDFIFDLPGQTKQDIKYAANIIKDLGVQQVATYPLFRFPYTRFKKEVNYTNALIALFRRRKMLKTFEDTFYNNGYDRSSVWAFTKNNVAKYCSVTVPAYIGLGASGSSYLNNIFYVNTFNVTEYTNALLRNKSPIALSVDLSEDMQMSGWLYWRIYETVINKADFQERFNQPFDDKYGNMMKRLSNVGFLHNNNDKVNLTDRGAYWIHAFEDYFSIDYISKLWGTSKYDPWPQKVVL